MRKAVMVEQSRGELARVIQANTELLAVRRKVVHGLSRKCDLMETRLAEQTELNHKRRAEEVEYFKNINKLLTVKLISFHSNLN